MNDLALSPVSLAALGLARRSGVSSVQIRYQDDELPIVWCCVVAIAGGIGRQVGAGFTPDAAVLACVEALVDGGTCRHCNRPTIFETDPSAPAWLEFCAYQFDPELSTFRRSCEGDTP